MIPISYRQRIGIACLLLIAVGVGFVLNWYWVATFVSLLVILVVLFGEFKNRH